MTIYADDIEGAQEDIKEAGALSWLVEPGAETGPENDPTPGAPVPHDCWAVQDEWTLRERGNTQIKATDKKFLLSTEGLSVTPNPSHKFAFAQGAELEIVDVTTIAPDGTPIIYILQARG